ncbi:MAG TPA: SRPBCC family protein [Ferruginibacter sp.]|nr:SRPBCC family protein [Ferruginibacter sp.]
MVSEITSTTPDCEIVSSRIVDVPREIVYRAWTEPGHLKNWWGPSGFTNTFNEFDLRPGGKWRFIMHGPGKGNYPNECEFIRIDKPALIAWKRFSKPLFRVVATFEEVSSGRTKIVFKMIFDSAGECNKVKKFAVVKNEENFDRLENELTKMTEAFKKTP